MGSLQKWFGDIRFWIGITFLHRLITITQAPLEVAHNWRQSTVCMVSRNFLEIDANPFFPRVDIAGDLSGITGMEFPLLNYLIYMMSLVFGYEHWYGRLINLVVSSAGVFAFYKILESRVNPKMAFNAAFILLFSLFYYYSRKIMPDTFSISIIFLGLYSWDALDKRWNWLKLIVGFLLITLGILSKLPSILVLVFVWPLLTQLTFKRQMMISIALSIAAVTSALWYFYWVPYLETTYGFQHFFMGQTMGWTFSFLLSHWSDTLVMFYEKALGYSGFAIVAIGLFFSNSISKNLRLPLFVGVLLFAVLMLKSGEKFTNHEYYIIPFIPVMIIFAAHALSKLPNRMVWILILAIIAGEGVIRKWDDQFIKNDAGLLSIEAELDELTAREDLFVVNSDEFPTPIYFAHRKGWLATNDQLRDAAYIERITAKGCRYILVLKQRFGSEVILEKKKVKETEYYILYEA